MSQTNPTVARDGDGNFVVAWQSADQDGDADGIFARRFHSVSGKALASEFQVNAYTTSAQRRASVAIRSGDFVIAWASLGQDGSGYGVFAQRFAALATLDIDGDGSYQALTDALLMLRFMFGFEGDPLIANAVGVNCTRCTAEAIESYLGVLTADASLVGGGSSAPLARRGFFSSAVLDVDDSLNVEPLEDGILVLRHAFGFQGATLVADAVDTGQCDRCTAEEIESYLDGLTTE